MSRVRLTRELALEARRSVPDGLGGYVESWVTLGRMWAEVVAGTGRDVAGEEVTVSAVPYRITVRAAPPGSEQRPRPDQRFREGTRVFRIVAVAERDAEGRFLRCFAQEEVPA
jgi:head-tail adaptor